MMNLYHVLISHHVVEEVENIIQNHFLHPHRYVQHQYEDNQS